MENNRILQNNKISHFILRIDFTKDIQIDYKMLSESLKEEFTIYKTELHSNYNVNIDNFEVKKEDFIKYLLSTSTISLKIDSFEKSIIVELQQYKDKSSYMQCLTKVIEKLKALNIEINSQRIGMRYINIFPCSKVSEISKILNPTDAKLIKETVVRDGIARSMIVHEYQQVDHLVRVQYGIPNRFYPSVIKNYDIVLDIDVYSSGQQSIDTWEESITQFNHQAYDMFISYIKESFLNTLK